MNMIDASFAREFLQRLHAAVNAHDAPAIAALCCDGVVWEDPAASDTLHGRDAVVRFHRDMMGDSRVLAHRQRLAGSPHVVLNMLDLARQIGAVPEADTFARALASGCSMLPPTGHVHGTGDSPQSRSDERSPARATRRPAAPLPAAHPARR